MNQRSLDIIVVYILLYYLVTFNKLLFLKYAYAQLTVLAEKWFKIINLSVLSYIIIPT